MSNRTKYSKYFKYLLIISLALLMSSCFASRRNPWARKQRKSHIDATQLGRNKYFFSNQYQKKLKRSYRKKRY
ncbi:MAG TPA: hypothetical protein VJ877_03165 [Bacteroidales bacterium]|nr:hypothetical protein [Bacteroidales bacterium]